MAAGKGAAPEEDDVHEEGIISTREIQREDEILSVAIIKSRGMTFDTFWIPQEAYLMLV
jgi:hypothetical protein